MARDGSEVGAELEEEQLKLALKQGFQTPLVRLF